MRQVPTQGYRLIANEFCFYFVYYCNEFTPLGTYFITMASMKTCRMNRQADRGITLVETMVTVTIMVILLMVAVPAYKSTIDGNRRATYATELLEDLTLARSEAIKRNKKVVVCASTSGTACSGNPSDWTSGWIMYVDANGNGSLDPGESVLRAHGALKLPAGWSATHNRTPFTFPFRPTGEIPGAGAAGFSICIMLQIDQGSNCPAGLAYGGQYSNIVSNAAGRLRIESQ